MYVDELARQLKRYWIADVQSGVSRAAQASDSGWQAWTISHLANPDPHPQYLTQPEGDGLYVPLSRTLTAGNLMQTIGTLGVDRTIAVDSSKLTVTGGKLDKAGAGTLTLSAATTLTLTLSSAGTLDLGGGSYLGAGFTVQAPASGTMALGAASASFSSINNFSTASHSHAVVTTQAGANNSIVATTANGDIVAGRDLTAVRYVGGGIASPTNALHGRDTSNQLRLDDGTNYGVFSVGGAGDLSLSLISSSRFFKINNISGTASFVSGFSGSGWRVDYGVTRSGYASLEVDDLVVRGRMRVYELLIHQIRFGNGSYLFTSGMKVVSVSGSGPYTLTADSETPHGLAIGDLIRAQRFTGSGTYQSNMQVTGVANPYTVAATLSSGDVPAAGMEFARLGNTSDTSRQGAVYITSDDSNAPYIDITDGVTSFAEWGGSAKNKVRIGKLSGITNPFWGTLSGYGITTTNGYFSSVKISGSAVIGSSIGMSLAASLYLKFDTAPNSWVPNWNGHLGQRPTVTGGVSGFPIGPFAGAGAMAAGQASTNLVTNPRFGNGTWYTNYVTDGVSGIATQTTDALFGVSAAKVAFTGTGNRYIYTAVTRSSTSNPLTVSAWVKSNTGISQIVIGVWNTAFSASSSSAVFSVGPNWTYISWTASAAALTGYGTTVRVLIVNDADNGTNKTLIVGHVQAEEKSFATPPISGDFGPGFAWGGTAHNSTSTRTAAGLEFSDSGNLPSVSGSAGGWFWAGTTNDTANPGIRTIFHTTTGPFLVLRANASNQLEGYWGGNTPFSGGTVVAGQWNHALITSDGSTCRLYLNGVQVASTAWTAALGTYPICVGSYTGTQQFMNGFLADLFITDRVVTADEALMIANANAPLAITRSNYELVLAEPGVGRVVANSGGIYGTDASNLSNFTLLNSTQTVNGESLAAASLLLGNNDASTGGANLLYNGSTGALSLRNKQTTVISLLSVANAAGQIATFDGVIGITTNGGIWQGSSGTFASPTTGFKLYTSSSKGIWESWSAGTKLVYIDPADMSLRAGGGNVQMNGSGLSLTSGLAGSNQIKWLSGANSLGYMYTAVVSSINTLALLTSNSNGNSGMISLNAQASGGGFVTLELDSNLVKITASHRVELASGVRSTGYGNVDWEFGTYTGGAPAATGYITVRVNGTVYKLLAST